LARSLILIAVIILILGGLFFLLRPDTPAAGPRERTFDLSIKGSEMNPSDISVRKGDRVTFRISTDKPMEFHMHGYDLEREVEPGQPAKLHFKADLTGRFEIEDHESERDLGVLQVRPR
jgi:hypothetical protein